MSEETPNVPVEATPSETPVVPETQVAPEATPETPAE